MDPESSRIAQAKAGVKAILAGSEYENIPFRLAQDWEINSSHFSRLFNKDILNELLDDLLVEKGILEKKPLKDPRPRVWMRTDDIDLAVETLFKHYELGDIIEAMTRHRDGRKIVSVEYAVEYAANWPDWPSQKEYHPIFPHFDVSLPENQTETSAPQDKATE